MKGHNSRGLLPWALRRLRLDFDRPLGRTSFCKLLFCLRYSSMNPSNKRPSAPISSALMGLNSVFRRAVYFLINWLRTYTKFRYGILRSVPQISARREVNTGEGFFHAVGPKRFCLITR